MSIITPIRKALSTEDSSSLQPALTEDEAGDLLEESLSSLDPYPINLDWLVPLLHYKHISSLTTHLKRHFEKEVDYKKCSVGGGVRAYTYQITVKCSKKICTKARHASRKQVAIYWIKMIDKKAGGIEDVGSEEIKKRRATKKRSVGQTTTLAIEGVQTNNLFEEDEDLDVEEDDDDDVDYSPYPNCKNNTTTAATANNVDIDSDVELDNSSSAYLRSLRHPTFITPITTATPMPQPVTSPMSTLALFNAATAPPQRRRDFSNVNILSRKRRQHDESWTTVKKEQKRAEDARVKEKVNHTRTNLRLLSQLALGLR